MSDPRQKPGVGSKNDPNLGQKEADREKRDLEKEPEQEDELEPMTDRSEQQPKE